MKLTLDVDIRVGMEQNNIRTENGPVKARAVYEARFYNRVGYLQKGKRSWTAYLPNGNEIGVYTHRCVALTELLYKALAFTGRVS